MTDDVRGNSSSSVRLNRGLIAGLAAGGALVAGYALSKRGSNRSGGVGESERLPSGEYHFIRTATIDRPASELWAFWREEENAPRFQKYVQSVRHTGGKTSHWVMQTPGGPRLEWDSEVFDERPGKAFSWRTIRGDWQQQGRVLLRPAPGNRGTEVRLEMWYEMPGGKLGHALGTVLGRDPQQLGVENLHRFKQLMEAGEIISVKGQPHGSRRTKGDLMQVLLREPEAEQKASKIASGWGASDVAANVADRVKEYAKGPAAEKWVGVASAAADVAKSWSKKARKSDLVGSAQDAWEDLDVSGTARKTVKSATKAWRKSAAHDVVSDVVDAAQERWKQAGKAARRSDIGKAWDRTTKAL